jgi:myo-inositol 2-dehydrogenase/D-chiro-inositol 1-dehydrogenase
MKEIRYAVLGAGRIGRLHARNLVRRVDGAEVVAVADVRWEAAEELGAELGVPKVYRDGSSAISHADVDAVCVCSSSDTHARLIEEAANQGKHVFCEKPIAVDLATIDHAVRAVERAGVVLQVGFNRRFDPSMRRVWQAVRRGEVGDVHLVRISSRDPEPPPIGYIEISGGIFMDMTIHDFDMARFLVGREVEEVYATGAALVDPEIGRVGDIDTAAITLRFEGGACALIDNSRRAVYGYDQRVEVFGDRGMARAENPTPHAAQVWGEQGQRGPVLDHFFIERYREAYVDEMSAFHKTIVEGAVSPVGGVDGRAPVAMAHAARRSLKENRPVGIDEVDPPKRGEHQPAKED